MYHLLLDTTGCRRVVTGVIPSTDLGKEGRPRGFESSAELGPESDGDNLWPKYFHSQIRSRTVPSD